MQLPFKAQVRRTGNSHVVTVPSDYIENGLVPLDREIQVVIEIQNGGEQ